MSDQNRNLVPAPAVGNNPAEAVGPAAPADPPPARARAAPKERSTRRAAFSFIELLLVIAFVAVLAGIVLPRMEPNTEQQLERAARVLAADLAYARNLAVTNNSSYRITFDPRANRYILTHSGNNPALDVLPASPFGQTSGQLTERITDFDQLPHLGSTARIVAAEKEPIGQPAATTPRLVSDLEFGPLGETSRPQQTTIWLAGGPTGARRFIAVRVAPVTGLVSIGQVQSAPPPTLQRLSRAAAALQGTPEPALYEADADWDDTPDEYDGEEEADEEDEEEDEDQEEEGDEEEDEQEEDEDDQDSEEMSGEEEVEQQEVDDEGFEQQDEF